MYLGEATDWLIRVIPTFIGAIVVFVIGWWAISKIDKSIKFAMNKRNFEPSLTSFLRTLFSIGAKTVLLIMIAGQIGFQTTSLAAIIGAVGLAVGLALQGSLANLAGGVLILLFKPYKVGDRITVNDFSGEVKEIQIFNTVLLLNDNKTAILPNGSVSNGAIINHTKQSFLLTEISFHLPLQVNQEEALKKVEKYILNDKKILTDFGIQYDIHEITSDKVHYRAALKCKPVDIEEVRRNARFNLLSYYKESNLV